MKYLPGKEKHITKKNLKLSDSLNTGTVMNFFEPEVQYFAVLLLFCF